VDGGRGGNGDAGLVLSKQRSLASGVIIDSDGYIMTNAHVVTGGQRIEVVLPGVGPEMAPMRSLVRTRGRTVEARVIGAAPEVDLALLTIDVRACRPSHSPTTTRCDRASWCLRSAARKGFAIP
jgi:serine protease Do